MQTPESAKTVGKRKIGRNNSGVPSNFLFKSFRDGKGLVPDMKREDVRGKMEGGRWLIMVHGEWFTVNGFLMENGENSHKL